MKDIKIEIASQEKIKFVEDIALIFTEKVLNIEGACISDESKISDFRTFGANSDKLKKIGPDLYQSEFVFHSSSDALAKFGKRFHLTKEERKSIEKTSIIELTRAELLLNTDIIENTKKLFQIDISEVINEPLFSIAFFISKKLSPEIRKKLLF